MKALQCEVSEIAETVEEILGVANQSICGIADAPDPAVLQLKEFGMKKIICLIMFCLFYILTLIYGYEIHTIHQIE